MTPLDRALLEASWRSWLSAEGPRVGPLWLQWVWTLLFCAALAAGFTLLGLAVVDNGRPRVSSLSVVAHWYGRNLIVCVTIGVLIHLLFDLSLPWARRRLDRWAGWKRSVYFGGVPMLGLLVGWPLGVMLAGVDIGQWLLSREGRRILTGSLLLSMFMTFLLHHWFAAKAREQEAQKRATEAQLRLLQGQIEPHFLFNTLANVQALIDGDPVRARAMLESFTDYLRASVGGLRREDGTLGSEVDLAEAYLRLLATRMDERLRYTIDVPDELRALALPPLLLQPLVENAVVHGLEPSVGGGQVWISARRDGALLRIEVRDDGRGLDAAPRPGRRGGAGVALQNLRDRLAGRWGARASLTLEPASPGTRATLRVPIDAA